MGVKLPAIPRDVTPEMYNYFCQLHNNIKQLEQQLELLKKHLNIT